MPPAAGPIGPTGPPGGALAIAFEQPAAAGPVPANAPVGTSAASGGSGPASESPTRSWSFLTIAGLLAWAEDAVATVGPDRLRTILELASLAGLLPADVRDALDRFAQLASPVEDAAGDAKALNVIDCVVVLHQLEAILQGETPTRLPLRRDAAWLGPLRASSA